MNKIMNGASFIAGAQPIISSMRRSKLLPLELGSATYEDGRMTSAIIVILGLATIVLAVTVNPLPLHEIWNVVSILLHPPTLPEIILDNRYLGLTLR